MSYSTAKSPSTLATVAEASGALSISVLCSIVSTEGILDLDMIGFALGVTGEPVSFLDFVNGDGGQVTTTTDAWHRELAVIRSTWFESNTRVRARFND